jgi:hypothetical protein
MQLLVLLLVRFMRAVLFAFLLPIIVAVTSSAESPKEPALVVALKGEIQKMDLDHPEDDAAKHIAQGDSRFLGIRGYSVTFPGTPDGPIVFKRIQQVGFRVVAGTAETISGDEHLRLIGIATQYAGRYNRYIWYHAAKSKNKT